MSNTDFGGKIMTKWEHINNKRSYSYLSYSHSRHISFSLSNLVSIPIGMNGAVQTQISYEVFNLNASF